MNKPLKNRFMRSLINGFEKADVESAIRGFADEVMNAWSIESQDECSEMLGYMEKWFPDIFRELKE